MKTQIKKLQVEYLDLHTARLMVDVEKSVLGQIPSADKPLTIEITIQKKRRSLNANAFMWVLLDKMARLVGGGITKIDLYKRYVREAGVFDTSTWVMPERYNDFKKNWERRGLGNTCSVLRKKNGMYNLICYFGTHYYTTDEMAFLINKIIADAESLGIPTLTPKEYAKMIEREKKCETRDSCSQENTE